MSLQNILLDIASEAGWEITNSKQKELATHLVNTVAKELWETCDLAGSLKEVTVAIDEDATESSMVSLPGFIDQIRGIKYSQLLGAKIPQSDMRPRYFGGRGWGANVFSLPFRIVRESAPLKRDISNASILTFSVLIAETADITITLIGATANSDRISETIVITAGTLSVDSIGNYVAVESIEKSTTNNQNIYVTDVEGNELSVISNNQLKPLYKWAEIQDANVIGGNVQINRIYNAIDVLYKPFFTPFVNLYDEFQAGFKYDRAIFYKFMEYTLAQQVGQETRALMAGQKAKQLIDVTNTDTDEARDLEVQWGRNGLSDAQNPYTWYKNAGLIRGNW